MSAHRDETGDTLIEVLAAVTILGIGVTGLMTALSTHVSATVTNRDQSQAGTALLAAAEYVKVQVFSSCGPGTATTITSAQVPRASGLTLSYGPGRALSSVPCASLTVVPVSVSGNGFSFSLDVVKRP